MANDSATSYELAPQQNLDLVLSAADDVPTLKGLLDQTAAVQELMKRMDLALADQNRAAEYRIRVARKLGLVLQRSVHRGGKGSNSHDAISIRGGCSAPLPKGITASQSSRFQHLAAIPDDRVAAYFNLMKTRHLAISIAGLVRASGDVANSPSRNGHNGNPTPLLDAVRGVVGRIMDPDVFLGPRGKRLGRSMAADLDPSQLVRVHGAVYVEDPTGAGDPWLEMIGSSHRNGEVSQAVVLFRAIVDEPGFVLIDRGGWMCCFLRHQSGAPRPLVAAYLGERRHGFSLAFRELGTVLLPARF